VPDAPFELEVVAPQPFAKAAGIPTARCVAEELLMVELATGEVSNPEARLEELTEFNNKMRQRLDELRPALV
jgi:hypothetical protein